MVNENTYKLAAGVLLCTTILAGAYAVNLQYKYTQLENDINLLSSELEDYTIQVDIMIDYGNGSIVWLNGTRIQAGANLLELTVQNCNPTYDVYEFGAFVTSINGVQPDDAHYWSWYQYQETDWTIGMVGADQFTLHDGYVLGWIYTGF